jgi:hypothetical protein
MGRRNERILKKNDGLCGVVVKSTPHKYDAYKKEIIGVLSNTP